MSCTLKYYKGSSIESSLSIKTEFRVYILLFQRIRERKPKVYSSYALNSDCPSHSKKLAKAENTASTGIRKNSGGSRPGSRAGSRAGSVTRASPSPVRRYSSYGSRTGSPSRASSSGRSSRSPDRTSNGYGSRKTSAEKSYSS